MFISLVADRLSFHTHAHTSRRKYVLFGRHTGTKLVRTGGCVMEVLSQPVPAEPVVFRRSLHRRCRRCCFFFDGADTPASPTIATPLHAKKTTKFGRAETVHWLSCANSSESSVLAPPAGRTGPAVWIALYKALVDVTDRGGGVIAVQCFRSRC